MYYIPIADTLKEFYHHLSTADVDRTIFSAKFGDGKTEFLHQFKKEYRNEYTFYTLYPVNYQIAPNEQVMEYIKRDLLFQLILNGTLTPIDNIPDSILLQWYINQNSFNIVKDIIKFAPSILGSGNQFVAVLKGVTALVKGIKEQCKKFKEFKTKITEGDFEEAVNIIGNLSEGAGNIYELDPISWLIAQSIANKGGKSVLIIEDLDRIDPAHLFRILNIFSAHIDRKYLCSDKTIYKDGEEKKVDELPNKFGFDKIIFVMDADSTKAAFRNFYGDSNYEGYISKFISKHIFEYSINDYANMILRLFTLDKFDDISELIIGELLRSKIKLQEKSVRDIAKALDKFEDAYRITEVKITEDFCFLSDTPFVKLLAFLVRLGVKRNHLSNYFKEMYEELFKRRLGIRTMPSKEKFIELLGCFAMDKDSIRNNGKIYYDGTGYQMLFNKDQDGYKILKKVKLLGNISHLEIDEFFEIEVDSILGEALHYVN